MRGSENNHQVRYWDLKSFKEPLIHHNRGNIKLSSSICIYEKDVIIRVGSKKFKCDQKFQEGKDLCIFHDERYLSNGSNHKNNEVPRITY